MTPSTPLRTVALIVAALGLLARDGASRSVGYVALDSVDGDGRLQACALIVSRSGRLFDSGVREEYSFARYAVARDGMRVDHLDGACPGAPPIDRASELAVPGGAVRFPTQEVVRVDAGGTELWRTSVPSGLWDALVDGEDLYVTAGSEVLRIALADGAVAWSIPIQP